MDKITREASGEAPKIWHDFSPKDFNMAGVLTREQAAAGAQREMQKFPSSDALLENVRFAANGNDRHQVRLNNAIVDIPNNLDPSKPIHFMTFFNGFGSGYSEGYRDYKLQEAMKNAPPNTVLVSARWQDRENSRNPSMSQFEQHGGLRGVLGDVFRSVPELKRGGGLGQRDDIGIAGFSAGYNAVGSALRDKQLAARVNNVVMLDSPSSAVRQYVYDNIAAFSNGNKRLSMVAGDWMNADYHAFERELHRRMPGGLPPTVRFTYTHVPHLEIPARYFRGAAF